MIRYLATTLLSLILGSSLTSSQVLSGGKGRFITDDEATIELLQSLIKPSGDKELDVFNTLTLNDIVQLSDGALAEMMGLYCIKDMTNKTSTVIWIYDRFGPDKLDLYLTMLSEELFLDSLSYPERQPFNDFVASLKTTGLTQLELKTLDRIIGKIKMMYDIGVDV